MKIQELRINNWILFGEKMRVQVSSLKGSGWIETYITADGDISHYTGIPLTPETLEKAGFEVEDKAYMTLRVNDVLKFVWADSDVDNVWLFYVANDLHLCLSDVPATKVHELQNLFYSLTGTELQIEL
jgi:hypothetical protein